MIFVDGEAFLFMIRRAFPDEFSRADHMPRAANWQSLFGTISAELDSPWVQVYWYTIREIDFFPGGDWERIPFEPAEKLLKEFEAPARELQELRTFRARKDVVNKYRSVILRNRETMERRLTEWHELQDRMSREYPAIQVKRPGWISCSMVDLKLKDEKGVDVGMVTDLCMKCNKYDTAVLITADGDYVPAIKALKELGKRFALLRIASRDGTPAVTPAWRLAEQMDIIIDVPFSDMAYFLGIPI